MKSSGVIAVVCLVIGVQSRAADSVNITSQSSSIASSSSISRATQNGCSEWILIRFVHDDSQIIGDLSASVEVTAASGRVAQSASALLAIQVVKQTAESTILVDSSLTAQFQ